MSLRIVSTPLGLPLHWPAARAGGFDPALRDALVPAPGLEPVLAKLARPDVLVITTGQQPGLFTGPLYTIHKALSARALAELLEARWQRPVVPVFWLAGDDHDFAEARTASWLRADDTVGNFALRPRAPDAPQLPMYRTPLGPEITELVGQLGADLKELQFGAMTRDWIARHWTPGRMIGAAYAGSLAELLAPIGIVAFDPTHRAAKRGMARHLIKALGLARDLDRDLATRAAELAKSGQDGGVVVGDGASLVMLEGAEGRDRLVLEGEGFVTRRSNERFTLETLQGIAASEPERLSPNVLLRPAVEAAILPTVAYVGGPGELRYWQLTPPIFARMRIEPQAPLPRWSGLVIEPHVDRLLASLPTTLEELLAPAGHLESRLARDQVPAAIAAALAGLRAAIAEEGGQARHAGAAIAPQLARALETIERKMAWLADRADEKVLTHLRRRDGERMRRIQRARESLRPGGRPQERVFTVAPFLARHGEGLLAELLATIKPWYAGALEGGAATS